MECIVCAACVLLAVAKEQRGFGTYEMIAAPRLDGWSAAARETTVALTVITCPLLSRSRVGGGCCGIPLTHRFLWIYQPLFY